MVPDGWPARRRLAWLYAAPASNPATLTRRARRDEHDEPVAGARSFLELDVGLREQPALRQLRCRRLKHLLHRHDDPEPPGSDLTPVCPTEDVAVLRQAVV